MDAHLPQVFQSGLGANALTMGGAGKAPAATASSQTRSARVSRSTSRHSTNPNASARGNMLRSDSVARPTISERCGVCPAPPSIIAGVIKNIIESDSWKLRHPCGPDAESFLGWRAAMTDEQWVDFNALDADGFLKRMKNDFALEVTL